MTQLNTSMITTADYVNALSAFTPRNSFGMIEGIYRADLLPALPDRRPAIQTIDAAALTDLDNTTTTDLTAISMPSGIISKYKNVAKSLGLPPYYLDPYTDELNTSFLPLDYNEGFPSINGKPFWAQLDFEPPEAFMNFEAYRDQPMEAKGNSKKGIRQLYVLETPSETGYQTLKGQSTLYYWSERARAYDTFLTVVRRRERERQAMDIENQHLRMGERLFRLGEIYLENNEDELQETMTPREMIEILKMATTLQRISVGMPANGPSPSNAESPTTSQPKALETMLRELASMQAPATATGKETAEEHSAAIDALLNDPKALELAQALAVQLAKPAN